MTHRYEALRVQSSPGSKPMYLTGIEAEELALWADVPRKREEMKVGYQRELNEPRVAKITEFIELDPAQNMIPGAVIVAVRPGLFKVSELGDDSGDAVRIEVLPSDEDPKELVTKALENIKQRLSKEELAAIGMDEGGDDGGDDGGGDDGEGDATQPESYLSHIAKELELLSVDSEQLSDERKVALREYCKSMSKPGLILDGQHRVWGAKNVTACSVKLPVVLLPELSDAEQVFHFYVLNNKARPLTATQLRSTVSTSLSIREIEELYQRFKQAGVTAEEARWTTALNIDEDSPFRGLVDFGLDSDTGFVKENVLHQLVSKFLKPSRALKGLTRDVEGWGKEGDYEYPLECFKAFWNAIKEKYDPEWQAAVENQGEVGPSAQLLYKVSMLCLQEYIMNDLMRDMSHRKRKGLGSCFGDLEEIADGVAAALEFIPGEFFSVEWQKPGLDTRPGHKYFIDQLGECVRKQGEKLGHLDIRKKPPQA